MARNLYGLGYKSGQGAEIARQQYDRTVATFLVHDWGI
jgi:hypothetical protein